MLLMSSLTMRMLESECHIPVHHSSLLTLCIIDQPAWDLQHV